MNDRISGAWALAFFAIVIVDYVMILIPGAPQLVAFVVIAAAVYAAFKFTTWYPKRAKATIPS